MAKFKILNASYLSFGIAFGALSPAGYSVAASSTCSLVYVDSTLPTVSAESIFQNLLIGRTKSKNQSEAVERFFQEIYRRNGDIRDIFRLSDGSVVVALANGKQLTHTQRNEFGTNRFFEDAYDYYVKRPDSPAVKVGEGPRPLSFVQVGNDQLIVVMPQLRSKFTVPASPRDKNPENIEGSISIKGARAELYSLDLKNLSLNPFITLSLQPWASNKNPFYEHIDLSEVSYDKKTNSLLFLEPNKPEYLHSLNLTSLENNRERMIWENQASSFHANSLTTIRLDSGKETQLVVIYGKGILKLDLQTGEMIPLIISERIGSIRSIWDGSRILMHAHHMVNGRNKNILEVINPNNGQVTHRMEIEHPGVTAEFKLFGDQIAVEYRTSANPKNPEVMVIDSRDIPAVPVSEQRPYRTNENLLTSPQVGGIILRDKFGNLKALYQDGGLSVVDIGSGGQVSHRVLERRGFTTNESKTALGNASKPGEFWVQSGVFGLKLSSIDSLSLSEAYEYYSFKPAYPYKSANGLSGFFKSRTGINKEASYDSLMPFPYTRRSIKVMDSEKYVMIINEHSIFIRDRSKLRATKVLLDSNLKMISSASVSQDGYLFVGTPSLRGQVVKMNPFTGQSEAQIQLAGVDGRLLQQEVLQIERFGKLQIMLMADVEQKGRLSMAVFNEADLAVGLWRASEIIDLNQNLVFGDSAIAINANRDSIEEIHASLFVDHVSGKIFLGHDHRFQEVSLNIKSTFGQSHSPVEFVNGGARQADWYQVE